MMRWSTRRTRVFLFLAAAALVLLPLCFLGYGSDNDTYSVLDAGRTTWHAHQPLTSRNPGYWVYEAIVYLLASHGGFVLINLATLLVAIVLLHRFLELSIQLGVRFPYLLAGSLLATPIFSIAATSTDDYLWSLLGLVLTAEILLKPVRSLWWAVVPAAFAISIRGSNSVVLAGLLLGGIAVDFNQHRRATRRAFEIVGVGVAAALLGGVPYIASWRLAGRTFSFLHSERGPDAMWSLHMHLGRALYKPLYVFGPFAIVVILLACIARRPQPAYPGEVAALRARAIPLFLGAVIANGLLFVAWPIEISYLLPGAFFLLLLLGFTVLARTRAMAAAFCAAVFSLNFVTPQLAEPNIRGQATAARFHLAIEPGLGVSDVRLRSRLRSCSDFDCYLRLYPGN